MIDGSFIVYDHKFLDRKEIDKLFMDRGDADDILIIKDGFITDTSYGNICLFDGVQWVTPRKPLLLGTCRERLLEDGAIVEGDISIEGLKNFEQFAVINAMRDLLTQAIIVEDTFK